jgi:hypothetical protein
MTALAWALAYAATGRAAPTRRLIADKKLLGAEEDVDTEGEAERLWRLSAWSQLTPDARAEVIKKARCRGFSGSKA